MTDHVKTGFRGFSRHMLAAVAACVMLAPALARAAGDAAHGEGSGGLPQLDSSTFAPQIFWALVLFAVLYWLMSRVALPKVGDLLEERRNRIEGDLERAEQLRTETKSVVEAYEAKLAAARGKAGEVIAEVTQETQAEVNARLAEVGVALARKVEAAEQRIANARAEALGDVEAIAADIAGAAVQQLGAHADSAILIAAVQSVRGQSGQGGTG